jgi:hypothetical protein
VDKGAEWVLGQTTLRVFEHDSGPDIPEIAWKGQRKTLFRVVEGRVQERSIQAAIDSSHGASICAGFEIGGIHAGHHP